MLVELSHKTPIHKLWVSYQVVCCISHKGEKCSNLWQYTEFSNKFPVNKLINWECEFPSFMSLNRYLKLLDYYDTKLSMYLRSHINYWHGVFTFSKTNLWFIFFLYDIYSRIVGLLGLFVLLSLHFYFHLRTTSCSWTLCLLQNRTI